MLAETAYNVIQALPETERQRLFSMLSIEHKQVKTKPKKDDGQWTVPEAKDYLAKLLASQKSRKASIAEDNLKVV